ncbi:MAG: hypothetical protein WBN40_05365 [Pseudomonadales bacterium]
MALAELVGACAAFGEGSTAGGFVDAIAEQVPLLRGYSVDRKHAYPIAGNAPIFVNGDNPQMVAALAGQLRMYFLSVKEITEATSAEQGFLLRLASGNYSTAGHASAVAQMTITVADSRNQKIFDQLNIAIDTQQSDSDSQHRLDAALHRAAAMLAGKS